MNPYLHLILGGARSGKSAYAEQQALALEQNDQRSVIYFATAQALDNEMQQRIAHHQNNRPARWQTIEAPLNLAAELAKQAQANPKAVLLVDCLTLWLTNALLAQCWPQEKEQLLKVVAQLTQPIILISNEVGSGIVPLGELSREFVDESGRTHQQLAAIAGQVDLIVAGLPLNLKSTGVKGGRYE